MSKFAKQDLSWLNSIVKNTALNIKEKIISRYLDKEDSKGNYKSTDINVLLNRVKVNQKNESRKKLFFSAAASTGLILFGLIIF
tara:strand:+ start:251 stop:502 length:252 start_codon:yes stop_codon:yes gene_type:complete